jgi:perosamine synthetase
LIPYGRHQVDRADIEAVMRVLESDWLTTGPKVAEFEQALADYAGARHCVAVSSGTAALHCAVHAIGLQPGDEVIVPAITFAATANCVIAMGATPIIVDVEPDTLLIDVNAVRQCVTPRTKAIIAVDYAGQPCDYQGLKTIAEQYKLSLISDSCHALGAKYCGGSIADLADVAVYSFHPVKHITTGEGGAVVTNDEDLAERMRRFRNHGIDVDLHHRQKKATWVYEVVALGFNYRITDFQCALGLSQLEKVDGWIRRRRAIASQYDETFETMDAVTPLRTRNNVSHAYHLYVVRIENGADSEKRGKVFAAMRSLGIGVNVHYIPLNQHAFYQQRGWGRDGQCPVAESAYAKILSLPIFPAMSDEDVGFVVRSIKKALD